jgi:signal transduction histidine kinase
MTYNPVSIHILPEAYSPAGTGLFLEAAREHVLIVDDSRTVRHKFASHLSAKYECGEASSAIEALTQLKTTEFAVVIADVMMPGQSGTELLRKIVENYPETAVIMVSGIDRPQRALDAVRLGAFDYLFKPCDLDVLEFTVERALERRTLLTNARRYKLDLENRNEELVRGKEQLQRLQAQIVQSEKMASLGQMVAGIAHELHNPVGFVYGNLDILEESINNLARLLNYYDQVDLDGVTAAGALEIKKEIYYETTLNDLGSIIADCREGTERIRDIVQNLRTFSRLDEAEFKKTDIHEGIDSTLRLLSRFFSSGNVKLVRDYGQLQPIDVYAGQLNQVWMNLLVNAAQAVSEKGGEIRIATRQCEKAVVVSIGDTGAGIAPEHLSRIFDPFFTTKPVGEGTGLGLSITFSIVARHGGTITVDSRPNEGATFTVTLPTNIEPASSSDPMQTTH